MAYTLFILLIACSMSYVIAKIASNTYYMNGLHNYMSEQYNDIIDNYDNIEKLKLFDDIYNYDMTVEKYDTYNNVVEYSSQENRTNITLSKLSIEETTSVFEDIIGEEDYIIIANDSPYYGTIMNLLKLDNEQIIMLGRESVDKYFSVSIPAPSILLAVELTQRYSFVSTLWLIPIMVPLCLLLSYSITKPLRKIVKVTKKIKNKDFSDRCNIHSSNEFELLGQCIDDMSDVISSYISEVEEQNIELNKNIELKNKYEKAQKEFISDVSHELKTPISNISVYTEGLQLGLCETDKEKEEYYAIILDECNKMTNLVQKLLTLSKVENQVQEEEPKVFDCVPLIKKIIRKYELKCVNTNIDVSLRTKEKVFIYFSEKNLDTVITNFVQNAYKYCGNPGKINVNIMETKDYIKICVFNNGKHIPENETTDIWNRFYKSDKSRKRVEDSHGLGLAIVKAIMENAACPYGFTNVDNGVEFYIELPKGEHYE